MIDMKNSTNTFTFQPAGRDEPVNIRTTQIDDQPWFFGTDVIQACGIASGTRGATYARIAEDRKCMVGRTKLGMLPGRDIMLVSEPGLYDIVIRSDKPEARVFQDWVTGTVLPSIRKTGGYLLNESARTTAQAENREAMPLPMDLAEALATAMRPVVEELSSVRALLAATLEKREDAAMDDLKRNQMFLARDLQRRGIGKGLSTGDLGYALTVFSAANGYPIGTKTSRTHGTVTNTYSLLAAERWQQGRT